MLAAEKPYPFLDERTEASMDRQDWTRIESEIGSLPFGNRKQGHQTNPSQRDTSVDPAKRDLEALLRHIEEALHQNVDPA